MKEDNIGEWVEEEHTGTMDKKAFCGHSEYVSLERFRAKNANIKPYRYPELKALICRTCGADISNLDLYRNPQP